MRRKQNALVPLEMEIIKVAKELVSEGLEEFYGFQMIKQLGTRVVTNGALYRALARLERMGYIESNWEDQTSMKDNRPRRKYYRLKETK